MPRMTICLPDQLYRLLLLHGDMAETTRAALHAYLGRSPAPLEDRLTRIEQRLEPLAAAWPPAWPPERQTLRPPAGRRLAATYLGKLCTRGHAHENGLSRRYKRSKECVDCSPIDRKERRINKASLQPG